MNINVNNELKKVREKEINDILEYAECGLTVKEIVEVTNYDITYVNDIIKNSPLQINEVTTNYKQVAKDIQKMMKKDRMKFISTKDIQDYVDNNADSPHKVEIDRIESELKKLRVSVVDKFPQRREELDKEDEPTVQKVVQMLKKASKAHAGQAKELEKAVKEEEELEESKMVDVLFKKHPKFKNGWTVVKVNNITDAEKNKAKRDSKNFMYVPSASIRDLTKAKPGDNFEFPQDNDPEGEIVKLREAQAVAGGKVHKFVTGNNITLKKFY